MLDKPAIVQTKAQAAAVIRLTIPRTEMRMAMGLAIQELTSTLAEQSIVPSGPLFSHHFRMDPAVFDFEVGFPIDTPLSPAGRVQDSLLPAANVARTVYSGPYEELGEGWSEFSKWIAAQGHHAKPDLWECYVTGPEANADPAMWRTELNQPLEPR
ncbi:MAG: GyrI-like domain-containing protein [Fimbriimonadaceae bacterium]